MSKGKFKKEKGKVYTIMNIGASARVVIHEKSGELLNMFVDAAERSKKSEDKTTLGDGCVEKA